MYMKYHMEFEEVVEKDRVFSNNRKMMATHWVSHHREDRYEEVTRYAIAVWDVKTKQVLCSSERTEDDNYYMGTSTGGSVYSLEFSADDRFLLVNGGKSEEDRIPLPDRSAQNESK